MVSSASFPESVGARLVRCLEAPARAARVADVRLGLGYTAVRLEDGRTGTAFTFRDEAPGGCSVFVGLRPLAGRPASDLVELLASTDPIEAGVGLACANALVNVDAPDLQPGDVLERLALGPEDDVGMVGCFGPLLEPVRRRARSLTIFERVTEATERLRPAAEAMVVLPRCSVALLTATSIINHTVDGLLRAAEGCREVVLLGASTPLVPEAFAGRRVTWLSGVVVVDGAGILQVVSEGGGMGQFGRRVRKVSRCGVPPTA
ncbi:MAG: DUF364 domain-containing protein [Deltaproteobacteria bacterium]|nr:DUF364 domain-containing protein [Deltaproteobacteria bacterium]